MTRSGRGFAWTVTVTCAVAVLAACGSGAASNGSPASRPSPSASTRAATRTATRTAAVPTPAHVVVVMEENHAYGAVLSSPHAPYLRTLAASGASFTRFYAITHPSQPNYVALFSGSTHGLGDDSCPHTFSTANLATQLRTAHRTFTGYSEGLPRPGYRGCLTGRYARKHVPWTDFANVPAGANQPLTAFPSDYRRLPTLSFVIPDLDHDMHDGTVAQADSWLRSHLDRYRRWAAAHDSLLIVTWDEDDHSDGNRIPTIVTGAGVRPGRYGRRVDLYSLLRTVEAMYRLPALGRAASRAPITDIWAG